MAAFRRLLTPRTTPLTFLLVGRTGVGKSSAVNALLGCEVAQTSRCEAATQGVNRYVHVHDGLPVCVVDTPGLCDALPEAGNDERYPGLIRAEVKEIDCLWYVTALDDTRVRLDEQRGIHLITQALGPEVWHRAVIVFTFADRVPPEEYQQLLCQRGRLIRQVIDGAIGEAAQARGPEGPEKPMNLPQAGDVPAVAVSDWKKETPDGKPWLGELFSKVLTRVSDSGVAPFLVAMKVDLHPAGAKEEGPNAPDASPTRIELSDGQKKEVRSTLLRRLFNALKWAGPRAAAVVGTAALQSVLGPVGAALGGAVGGFVQWLARDDAPQA